MPSADWEDVPWCTCKPSRFCTFCLKVLPMSCSLLILLYNCVSKIAQIIILHCVCDFSIFYFIFLYVVKICEDKKWVFIVANKGQMWNRLQEKQTCKLQLWYIVLFTNSTLEKPMLAKGKLLTHLCKGNGVNNITSQVIIYIQHSFKHISITTLKHRRMTLYILHFITKCKWKLFCYLKKKKQYQWFIQVMQKRSTWLMAVTHCNQSIAHW